MPEADSVAGLGREEPSIRVFMANRPDYPLTGPAGQLLPANGTLIENINRECGNGWRKVFNVYAKWVFALSESAGQTRGISSWQQYRDELLLTEQGSTALWFEAPEHFNPARLNIVMGKTFAGTLGLTDSVEWLTADFAVCLRRSLIVTPYFDYRQLTNEKIGFLNHLIRSRPTLLKQAMGRQT